MQCIFERGFHGFTGPDGVVFGVDLVEKSHDFFTPFLFGFHGPTNAYKCLKDKIKVFQQKKQNNDIDAVFEFLILLKLSFFCCFCHSFFRLNDKDTELPPLRKGDWYDWLWC